MSNYETTGKVMSAETLAIVVKAIKDLHSAFGVNLPAADDCGAEEQLCILSRAWNSIGLTEKAKRADVVKAARVSVDAVIAARRAELGTLEAELSKLSPALRALVGKSIPENIMVGLSEVQGAFPQGTTETDMVKALHDMGYALAKGAKGDKGVRLCVPRVPAAKE
jgi:hypothetical protein